MPLLRGKLTRRHCDDAQLLGPSKPKSCEAIPIIYTKTKKSQPCREIPIRLENAQSLQWM